MLIFPIAISGLLVIISSHFSGRNLCSFTKSFSRSPVQLIFLIIISGHFSPHNCWSVSWSQSQVILQVSHNLGSFFQSQFQLAVQVIFQVPRPANFYGRNFRLFFWSPALIIFLVAIPGQFSGHNFSSFHRSQFQIVFEVFFQVACPAQLS